MNFQGFDVRHLTILDTLFTELHVGRAAQRLNLSQPAISNSLAWLRRHFGDPLLVRGGRTLRLTPFAERLREPVRRLLLDFRTVALDRPGFDVGTATRRFRITLSEYCAAMIVPGLVRRMAEIAPGIDLECRPISSNTDEFERGEIDLLILPWYVLHRHHRREPLFRDEWVCVTSADRADVPDELTWEEYTAGRHILPDTQQSVGWELEAIGVRRQVAAIVPHLLLPGAVAGTPLLATIPRGMIRRAPRPADLRVRPLPAPIGAHVIGMQWHHDADGEPATSWLRALVREVVNGEGLEPADPIDASLNENDPDQQT
ncbi:MAG: transcriptional regulator [Sphingomonas bacterium]|jgi:LysR family nod box-dependent transcriptional activator|nr:LysR family transcriptional regulator [Sphingomonas bacterium]MDB5688969.1 transcriptional regulator [Sphingomonas bacterium]